MTFFVAKGQKHGVHEVFYSKMIELTIPRGDWLTKDFPYKPIYNRCFALFMYVCSVFVIFSSANTSVIFLCRRIFHFRAK